MSENPQIIHVVVIQLPAQPEKKTRRKFIPVDTSSGAFMSRDKNNKPLIPRWLKIK